MLPRAFFAQIDRVVIVPLEIICMIHGLVLTTHLEVSWFDTGLLNSETGTPLLHPLRIPITCCWKNPVIWFSNVC
jgi:hypothetical protein